MSTTSSSRRKHPITASSRRRAALVLCGLALLGGACRGARQEAWLTHYSPEHALSVRYPASWKTEQAEQDGTSYRYFTSPPTGSQRKPAATLVLIATPLGMPLETYAQNYLAGNNVTETKDEERQGARGKLYYYSTPDGGTRHVLLLLQEQSRVYGLHAEGANAPFQGVKGQVEEMMRSLTLERYAGYVEEKNERYGFSLKVPPSWKQTRTFSSGTSFLKQYTSPALGNEKRQTIHASLTVTVEALPPGATLDTFYKANIDKLGEAFKVIHHGPWRGGGYLDAVISETQVAVSRSKRYYRVADGRGYILAFEARDDIYPRVTRWCDMIANTMRVGAAMNTPPAPLPGPSVLPAVTNAPPAGASGPGAPAPSPSAPAAAAPSPAPPSPAGPRG